MAVGRLDLTFNILFPKIRVQNLIFNHHILIKSYAFIAVLE